MLIMHGRYIRESFEVVKKSDESLEVEANKTRGRCIKSLRSIQKYPEQGRNYMRIGHSNFLYHWYRPRRPNDFLQALRFIATKLRGAIFRSNTVTSRILPPLHLLTPSLSHPLSTSLIRNNAFCQIKKYGKTKNCIKRNADFVPLSTIKISSPPPLVSPFAAETKAINLTSSDRWTTSRSLILKEIYSLSDFPLIQPIIGNSPEFHLRRNTNTFRCWTANY